MVPDRQNEVIEVVPNQGSNTIEVVPVETPGRVEVLPGRAPTEQPSRSARPVRPRPSSIYLIFLLSQCVKLFLLGKRVPVNVFGPDGPFAAGERIELTCDFTLPDQEARYIAWIKRDEDNNRIELNVNIHLYA